MSTVGTSYNTLADIMVATTPEGSVERDIADRTARTNELLQYLPWRRGNKTDGNQVVQRVKLPTVGYIKYNKAPTKSKGGRIQIEDRVGVMKNFSDVDVELANAEVDPAGYRREEDMCFMEAFNQQFADDSIYGTEAGSPEKFNGLAVKYAAPNTTRNNYGYYMINGGGSGSDNTSIWLVSLGMDGVHGLYGKNGVAGITMKDHGKVWGPDADGNDMQWYRSEIRWEVGIQVRRPGAAVRICNIDKSNLTGESSAADLSVLIQRAIGLLEPGLGKPVFLCNRTTKTWLRIQASKETTLGLHDVQDTFGKPIPAIDGIPVLQHDALTNAEATIAGTFQSDI